MFISSAMAATTDAAQGAAEAGGVFPPFDSSTYASQLFWLAISFGVFYWLMNKILVPRIGGILETRQSRIAEDLAKAQELKDDTDNAMAAYEQELATAKANANEIGTKARDKAKAEAEAEQARIEADLADKMKAAETRISEVRTSAMAEVGTIAKDATGSIIEQLIGAKVTAADLKKVIAATGK